MQAYKAVITFRFHERRCIRLSRSKWSQSLVDWRRLRNSKYNLQRGSQQKKILWKIINDVIDHEIIYSAAFTWVS